MRRAILAFVLALVAVTVAPEVVGRSSRAEAAGPDLTINPPCVDNTTGTMTLTFSGTGFTDDSPVRIYDEDKPNRPPILAGTNKSGTFTVQATVPAKPAGWYFYRAEEGPTNKPTQGIGVPCGRITIDPTCGPAITNPSETYKITVKGTAFPPTLLEQPNDANITFAGVSAGSGFIEFSGEFTTTITVPRRAPGFYTITATDAREKYAASFRFMVPCRDTTTTATETTATTAPPKIPPPPTVGPTAGCVLDPPVGPPGFVTQARCSGFPANSTATLRWSPGIGVVTVGTGSGSFSTPVLILPRDRVGPRNLIAEAPGVSVPIPFMVVPPSVAPSGGDVATHFLPQLVRRY